MPPTDASCNPFGGRIAPAIRARAGASHLRGNETALQGPVLNKSRSMGRTRFAVAMSCAIPLFGCLGFGGGSNVTYVEHPTVDRPATVDPGAAAAIISAYRKKSWLGSVTVDPTLSAIAAKHAKAMASADKLAHVLPGEGSFEAR